MGKKIACLIGSGFEDSEFRVPYGRLEAEGHDVVLIGKKKGETVEGKQGHEKVQTELSIDEARVEDFDLLLIPGGFSPDKLRADERFVDFVKAFDQSRKPIAAVCHGPQLFMSARIVEGRTLTAWKTVQDDLRLIEGVTVLDEPVVHDDNWITSRQPDDLEDFSAAILQELQRSDSGLGASPEVPAHH
jgi:protease I